MVKFTKDWVNNLEKKFYEIDKRSMMNMSSLFKEFHNWVGLTNKKMIMSKQVDIM